MAYPLINQGLINGSDALIDAGDVVRSFKPMRFGGRIYLRLFTEQEEMPLFPASGLAPARFGSATLAQILSAQGLGAAQFGVPEVVLLGMEATLPATGFVAAAFGQPAAHLAITVPDVAGAIPVRFGATVAAFSVAVAGLHAGGFGVPSMVRDAKTASLRPVRFGKTAAHFSHGAQSLQSAGFGRPAVKHGRVDAQVVGVVPVVFGTPALGGYGLRARTACPVQFGRPTLSRSTPC